MGARLSLLDVLPRHERVDIGGGQQIDVFGISGEDLGKILERYPDVFQEIMSHSDQPTRMTPGLMAALLAASQRDEHDESLLGNEVVEQRCRTLAVGAQVKMFLAMGRCTFPDGVGPFLESYMLMSSAAMEAVEVVVQVASREPAMASPPMRKRSEVPDTQASGS